MNFLTADVAIIIDASKLPAQLARAKRATQKTAMAMEKSFKKMDKAIKKVFSNIARYAKLAVAAFIGMGVAAVKMASDIEDSEDFFEMSMGNMAKSSRQWSEQLADSLHISQYEVRETVAIFNEMITSMGMNEKAAAAMSQRYTQLSYDLVSFHPKVRNLEEASKTLQGALTGERETLKRLGYYYSENEVKLESIKLGYGKNLQALTALQKAKLNDIILMRKMKNVHGDLNRTLNNSQNVFRAVWTQIKLTAIALGEVLRPAITEVATEIRDKLIKNQEKMIQQFKGMVEWGKKAIKVIGDYKGAISALVKIVVLSVGTLGVGWIAMKVGKALAAIWLGMKGMAGAIGVIATANVGLFTKILVLLTSTAKVLILTLGKMFMWGAAIGFAVYEVGRLVLGIREYIIALKNAAMQEGRFTKILEDAAGRRFEARMKESEEMWPKVALWPEDIRDPSKIVLSSEQIAADKKRLELSKESAKNYKEMMNSLRFEYDMLGETNDVRERAEAQSAIQKEINNMLDVDRNALMEDYMSLLDKLIEKQNSLGYAIKLWMDASMEWGKNFGEVLTNAFDRAAESFADMLSGQAADWKAFSRMFLKELLVMIIKLQMAVALKGVLGWSGALFGGGGVAPTQATGINPTASPVEGLQHGGEVLRTGLAVVHRGETFLGVGGGTGRVEVNITKIGSDFETEVDEFEEMGKHVVNIVVRDIVGGGKLATLMGAGG